MMTPDLRIRTWVRGTADDERAGLLGYLSVHVGDLLLDGLTVRRTAQGRLTLAFPERRDRQGRRHPYFRPVDDAARQRFERAVFAAARVQEDLAW